MKIQILRLAGTRRFWFDGGHDRFAFGLNLLPGRWGLALFVLVDKKYCLGEATK